MIENECIEGVVEGISFQNTDNGWSVIEVLYNNKIITATGTFVQIAEGEQIKLYGTWTEHPVYGKQFKVDSYESKLPETSAQLLRYLSSRIIPGIGPKTAVKIIDYFGDDAIEILQFHPERLVSIKGISRQKAEKICEEFQKQYALRTVIAGLEKYGIRQNEAIWVYKALGINALTVIKTNPYMLCGLVRGFDWYRCEEIARQTGNEINAEYRTSSAVIYLLKSGYYEGSTCSQRSKLKTQLADMLLCSMEEIDHAIDELIATKMIFSENIDGEDFLFDNAAYQAEKSAAEKLVLLSKFPAFGFEAVEKDILQIEDEDDVCYEEKQKQAIITACSKGILILTGGPGTGKTTTIKGMLSLFKRYGLKIELAAPTGRAAKRMSELTGVNARTIHRLLEAEWTDDEKSVFGRNNQNPIEADVVIVDEMSMVDAFLWFRLVDALRIGTRLIMVGDTDQLPSVGPGNVLADLISSEKFPVVRLTEIFRQARTSLIVMNAHKIIAGTPPVLDDKNNDFFFMKRPDSISTAQTVAELNFKRLPTAYGYDILDDIQVLCPSKKGECGTVNLNNRLQELLNPAAPNKQEHKMPTRTLRTGDKVMQIRNNYDLTWRKNSEDGKGIFNGDIGKIRKISHGNKTITIDFDGRIAEYPMEKLEELELAYAITIHKSQGSEFPAVIIPLIDAPNQLLNRNLIYTAVTRAKSFLVIVGSQDILFGMISKEGTNLRNTGLCHFIKQRKAFDL